MTLWIILWEKVVILSHRFYLQKIVSASHHGHTGYGFLVMCNTLPHCVYKPPSINLMLFLETLSTSLTIMNRTSFSVFHSSLRLVYAYYTVYYLQACW